MIGDSSSFSGRDRLRTKGAVYCLQVKIGNEAKLGTNVIILLKVYDCCERIIRKLKWAGGVERIGQ